MLAQCTDIRSMNDSRFFTRGLRTARLAVLAIAAGLAACADAWAAATPDDMDDAYLWLEDIDSPRALAWARARNAETAAALEARPDYAADCGASTTRATAFRRFSGRAIGSTTSGRTPRIRAACCAAPASPTIAARKCRGRR